MSSFQFYPIVLCGLLFFTVAEIKRVNAGEQDAYAGDAYPDQSDIQEGQAVSECHRVTDAPPNIQIRILDPDFTGSGTLKTDYSLSKVRDIAKSRYGLGTESLEERTGQPGKVVALADVRYGLRYEYNLNTYTLAQSDIECAYIESITFEFAFNSPPTVLIPNELFRHRDTDGGVCYDQVLAHEMEHVRDYEQVFDDAVVTMRQDERFLPNKSLPSASKPMKVARGESDNIKRRISQLVTEQYDETLTRSVQEISEEMRYRASLLDSTDEYQRITELCSEMHEFIR